jgi:HK97 family phage major capsid protein
MTLIETKQKRAQLVDEARALYNKAETENRDLNADEKNQFDTLMTQVDELGEKAARLEKLSGAEAEQSNSRRMTRIDTRSEKADALRSWLIAGSDIPLTADQQRSLDEAGLTGKSFKLRLRADVLQPREDVRSWADRAQSVGTASAGGYLVAQEFSNEVEKAMLAFGGIRQIARVIRTATGADLPWPLSDDTANEAVIVGENTELSEGDMEFDSKTLKAFKYTSNIIKVSTELLQDSAVNIAEIVGGALGERIARGTNRHFTVGTGTSQPEGAVTGSVLGKTGASTTSVTYDELIDLIHSVDPAYRIGAKFMFHDDTLKVLKKLKDGNGKPLWVDSLASGEPATINGYEYVINQHMAPMATGAKSILFGNFSKLIVRDVQDVSLVRLDERFAEFGQVAFVALSRHDSRVLNAGQNPIKHFKNA